MFWLILHIFTYVYVKYLLIDWFSKLNVLLKEYKEFNMTIDILMHTYLTISWAENGKQFQHNAMRLTIIETPAMAWTSALSPSEMLLVMDCPTMDVSVDNRLISSPVFVLSKKAISWWMIEPNSRDLIRFTTRWPEIKHQYIWQQHCIGIELN